MKTPFFVLLKLEAHFTSALKLKLCIGILVLGIKERGSSNHAVLEQGRGISMCPLNHAVLERGRGIGTCSLDAQCLFHCAGRCCR